MELDKNEAYERISSSSEDENIKYNTDLNSRPEKISKQSNPKSIYYLKELLNIKL